MGTWTTVWILNLERIVGWSQEERTKDKWQMGAADAGSLLCSYDWCMEAAIAMGFCGVCEDHLISFSKKKKFLS